MGGTGYFIRRSLRPVGLRDDADQRRHRIAAAEAEAVAINLSTLGDSIAADVFDAIKGTLIFNPDSEEERVDLYASNPQRDRGDPPPGVSAKVEEEAALGGSSGSNRQPTARIPPRGEGHTCGGRHKLTLYELDCSCHNTR
jgi:hypothetical protein